MFGKDSKEEKKDSYKKVLDSIKSETVFSEEDDVVKVMSNDEIKGFVVSKFRRMRQLGQTNQKSHLLGFMLKYDKFLSDSVVNIINQLELLETKIEELKK